MSWWWGGDERGDQQLVAYIVPAEVAPTVSALRHALARTLPEYLIPSVFVQMPALLLTPNGKVNRLAFRAGKTRPALDVPLVAPQTPWSGRWQTSGRTSWASTK